MRLTISASHWLGLKFIQCTTLGIFLGLHVTGAFSVNETSFFVGIAPPGAFFSLVFLGLPLIFVLLVELTQAIPLETNLFTYPTWPNSRRVWRWLTGPVTLIFVLLYMLKWWGVLLANDMLLGFFANLSPAIVSVFLIMASAHFCLNLWAHAIDFGITVSQRAQRFVARACVVLFMFFSILFLF